MPVIPFEAKTPILGANVFIAPDAWAIGNVAIGENASIFFGSVLRGDINRISVGAGTNIQEHSVLHTSTGLADCIVGANVTVGHRAILHGCTVRDTCIIGMGSTILDGALVEEHCVIGANSLVTMNTKIEAGSLAVGAPARVVRRLTSEEIRGIEESAAHYRSLAKNYLSQFASR